MSLAYSRIAGNKIKDGIQIARDGDRILYYIDEDIDILKDQDQDDAEELITNTVDEVVETLRLCNLTTSKLINVDSDVLAKEPPTDRYGKRIYNGVKEILSAQESKTYEGEKIQVIPRCIEDQRDAAYVFAPSGAGKSTWCAYFALEYLRMYPGNRVFIFSRKEFDPIFDNVIPGLIRVVMDRNFVRNNQQRNGEFDPISEYRDSLVIFDDFLKIEDATIRKSAERLKNAIFELGRQYNINILSVQHKGLGGAKSITELTECSHIICFPKMNIGESKRLVEKYLCFSKMQMERIFDEEARKERWMAIIRPNIIITEHYIKIIN